MILNGYKIDFQVHATESLQLMPYSRWQDSNIWEESEQKIGPSM